MTTSRRNFILIIWECVSLSYLTRTVCRMRQLRMFYTVYFEPMRSNFNVYVYPPHVLCKYYIYRTYRYFNLSTTWSVCFLYCRWNFSRSVRIDVRCFDPKYCERDVVNSTNPYTVGFSRLTHWKRINIFGQLVYYENTVLFLLGHLKENNTGQTKIKKICHFAFCYACIHKIYLCSVMNSF